MSQQKRWKLFGMVWKIIENLQKKATNLAHICQQPSFYRKYRNTSLAIMNNFSSLEQAVSMSRQYEVPLIRLSVATTNQQDFVWGFILNCFENSQILNQGFIFWPQFSKFSTNLPRSLDPSQQQKNQPCGLIQCYCDDKIYKTIKIKELPSNQEQISDILVELRAQYYLLISQNADDRVDQVGRNEVATGQEAVGREAEVEVSDSESEEVHDVQNVNKNNEEKKEDNEWEIIEQVQLILNEKSKNKATDAQKQSQENKQDLQKQNQDQAQRKAESQKFQ